MAYNKARAEKEWLEWKNKEETQLRELGVDEDTIQFLHTYDWEMFKADRNYRQRHINIGTIPEIVSEDSSTTPRSVEDFLDNIEDERLYRLLREVDSANALSQKPWLYRKGNRTENRYAGVYGT